MDPANYVLPAAKVRQLQAALNNRFGAARLASTPAGQLADFARSYAQKKGWDVNVTQATSVTIANTRQPGVAATTAGSSTATMGGDVANDPDAQAARGRRVASIRLVLASINAKQ